MIIWLNGAFGAGKTQTAYELHRRIPNSFIYDPEQVGFFIQKNLPKQLTNRDFQDHKIWRSMNVDTLKYIDSSVNKVILVPMTIVNEQYFDDVIGRLKRDGVEVHHYVLSASEETLKKRLKSRFEKENGWPAQQIPRCLEGLSSEIFTGKIDTNQLSVAEVAEKIAEDIGITLMRDERSTLKQKLDLFKMRLLKK